VRLVANVVHVVDRRRASSYKSREGEQEEKKQLHVEDSLTLVTLACSKVRFGESSEEATLAASRVW
jgi:hypothetical protein